MVEPEVTKASESRSSQMGLARSCALLAISIAPAAMLVAALAGRGFSTDEYGDRRRRLLGGGGAGTDNDISR